MSFDTINYYIFFPIFLIFYWLFPFRARIPLMLAASYYFYSCVKPIYLVLIVFSTLVDFFSSREIEKNPGSKKFLWVSVIVNVTLLSTFKYLDFAISILNDVSGYLSIDFTIPRQELEFPIGISFYTLQTLSYTFDVFRGKISAEKNIFRFSLFVCFFPQLIAGPLERAGKLLPQFNSEVQFDYNRSVDGIHLILWGLLKKTIVSDRLVHIIADIYQNEHASYSGMHFILAGFLINAKFYSDFSGYADMAVGSAKLLGYDLSKNFDYPFWTTNISDFWRRWHVTLSTWLHDYIYKLFPVKHNNPYNITKYVGILTVFIVSGLWHGPNWTFVFWGFLNGFFCVTYIFSRPLREFFSKITRYGKLPETFRFLIAVFLTNTAVALTMIVFMSPTIEYAFGFIGSIFSKFSFVSFDEFYSAFGIYQYDIVIALVFITFVEIVNFFHERNYKWTFVRTWPIYLRWPIYMIAFFGFLLFSYEKKSAFSYFYY